MTSPDLFSEKMTAHMKSTTGLRPCMCGFDDDIFNQPDGFPGLDGAVLEVLVDSTAGRLGGDFTDE